MLQYEWRPVHDIAIAADDANIDVPEDDKNLLVPDPVEQKNIVQYPKPFAILSNDEESENDNGEAQQVLPDQIKNQGAEDTINAKQNDFERNQEDQGAPQKVQGSRKDHGNRRAQIEVKDVLEGEKSDNGSDINKEEPESRKEDCEERSNYFNTPTDKEYGRRKQERKQGTSFSFLQNQFEDMTTEDISKFFTMPGSSTKYL